MRLDCQPANSPAFNVLDLGFFSSIQRLQHQSCPTSTNELIKCVEEAYWAQPVEKADFIFLKSNESHGKYDVRKRKKYL